MGTKRSLVHLANDTMVRGASAKVPLSFFLFLYVGWLVVRLLGFVLFSLFCRFPVVVAVVVVVVCFCKQYGNYV